MSVDFVGGVGNPAATRSAIEGVAGELEGFVGVPSTTAAWCTPGGDAPFRVQSSAGDAAPFQEQAFAVPGCSSAPLVLDPPNDAVDGAANIWCTSMFAIA